MKKTFVCILLCGVLFSASAQTDKGDWIVGGRIDLNTGENSSEFGFNPDAGIFVINNLAVGANLDIDYLKSGDTKTTRFGVGPFARFYFTRHMVRPLVHGNVNYISSKVKAPGFTSTNNGTNLFLGGGLAYFINQNIALEGLIGYSNTKYKDFEGSGGLSIGIGFQAYLSRRQVEKMRGQ